MWRNRVLGAAAAMWLVLATFAQASIMSSPTVEAPVGVSAAEDLLARAMQAYKDQDLKGSLALLKATIAHPNFAGLSLEERHEAYFFAGVISTQLGDFKTAQDYLKKSSGMDNAAAIDWHERLAVSYALRDVGDCVLSLITIAQRWPTSLAQVRDRAIGDLAVEAGKLPDGKARRFELLFALSSAHWKPNDPVYDMSSLWVDLAGELLARGEVNEAVAVAEDVTNPGSIIAMRSERAFDPVIGREPVRYDVGKAQLRYVERLRGLVSADPSNLGTSNELAKALMRGGQDEAALKLLDELLARARSGAAARPPVYTDMGELIWTMNYRAWVLLDLGRYDEATTALEEAALKPEDGNENVSQMINLAELYSTVGRPADALRVIGQVADRNMSPYGAMQVASVRAEAYAQTGNKEGYAKALAFATAHAADAPSTLTEILLFGGDLDGVAKSFIQRLADPDQRRSALLSLQVWRKPPEEPAFTRELDRRLSLVRERPDVRAAVDAVGRIESYDIYEPFH